MRGYSQTPNQIRLKSSFRLKGHNHSCTTLKPQILPPREHLLHLLGLRVMQTHGLNDQLVPFDTAKWLHELLIKNHAQVTTNNTSTHY